MEFYFPSVHLTAFAIKKKSLIFQYCKIEKKPWYKQIPEKWWMNGWMEDPVCCHTARLPNGWLVSLIQTARYIIRSNRAVEIIGWAVYRAAGQTSWQYNMDYCLGRRPCCRVEELAVRCGVLTGRSTVRSTRQVHRAVCIINWAVDYAIEYSSRLRGVDYWLSARQCGRVDELTARWGWLTGRSTVRSGCQGERHWGRRRRRREEERGTSRARSAEIVAVKCANWDPSPLTMAHLTPSLNSQWTCAIQKFAVEALFHLLGCSFDDPTTQRR